MWKLSVCGSTAQSNRDLQDINPGSSTVDFLMLFDKLAKPLQDHGCYT